MSVWYIFCAISTPYFPNRIAKYLIDQCFKYTFQLKIYYRIIVNDKESSLCPDLIFYTCIYRKIKIQETLFLPTPLRFALTQLRNFIWFYGLM